jgi:predicted RNase H-like HicB family nuclease
MKKFSIILLAFCVALAGCASQRNSEAKSFEEAMGVAPAAPMMMYDEVAEAEMAPAPREASTDFSQSIPASVERVVIKNANLSIIVDDPASAMKTISEMADEMGGFVVSSDLYKTTTSQGIEVPVANVTVRVPAEQLDQAMENIKKLVENPIEDVLSENVSGQDVTQEYTDLNSRLDNLKRAEAQLQEILASATKTEDVLAVFNQLKQVREEIEVLQGQINYYKEASRLSSISVNIQAKASVQPVTIGGWQPVGVARDAVQALINALKFLANALIWILIFFLPVLLVLAIPAWLIIRAIVRAIRKQQQKKAAKVDLPAGVEENKDK